jgi:hypothetical protein
MSFPNGKQPVGFSAFYRDLRVERYVILDVAGCV